MVARIRPSEEGDQFCTSCGEKITEKLSSFCPKCGELIKGKTSTGAVPNKSRTITKVIWIIVSLLIPLVGIAVGLKYLFTKNRRKYGCLLFCLGILCLGALGNNLSDKSETNQSTTTKIEVPTMTAVPTKTPQQIKAVAVDIGYDPLYRNIETHIGKIIHLRGKAVQVVIVGGDRYNLRLAMDGDYDHVVWVTFKGDRVLEDDTVELWGTVEGLYSYKSVFGEKITLPEINSLIGVVTPP
tara:strand:- start:144 stop:863 length:720 start_codon:yes stop_codon:yes gene_type:complete